MRAERLGVLDVVLREPSAADALDTLSQLVIVLGYLLPAADNDTDIVERLRRERPLELPAEMQWPMLPIRACSCDQFSSAWPVSWFRRTRSAGALFDGAAGTDELFVSVIDAMGHGLRASLPGTLVSPPCRRTGLALADQLRQADRVLHSQVGGG